MAERKELVEKIFNIIENVAEDFGLKNGNYECSHQYEEVYALMEAKNHSTTTLWIKIDDCEKCSNDIELVQFILYNIAFCLKRFNAEDEFDLLWSNEFGKYNKFTAFEFVELLKEDEKYFKEVSEAIMNKYREFYNVLQAPNNYID